MTPKVSVLMSVFNGERWLSESIQSILAQTFRDFEFIIINDGSTDGSADIIKRFADQDSRIRFFFKSNTGLSDSLNYGMKRARGEWIARIDADDKCERSRLSRQIELIHSDRELVLVGTGLMLIDEYGSEGGIYEYPVHFKKLLRRLVFNFPFFAHSSAMYNTELALAVGGYRARIHRAEDHDLWLRLSEHGKLGCINLPLVAIRKHDNQISNDDGGKRQLIDSCVARVSYWLRHMEYEDPVQVLTDAQFSEFSSWVGREIENVGVFKLISHVSELRKQVQLKRNVIDKMIFISISAINSPLITAKWLRSRVLGSNLPKILAIKWIRRRF